MKDSLLVTFLLFSSLLSFSQTVLYNNGSTSRINSGCVVYIQNGDAHNDQGQLQNAGTLIIDQDFINDDQASSGGASGTYELKGDFVNNSVFVSDQGEVKLSGANQQITGSSITTFYNLNLLGTGVKTMTLNARVSNQLKLNDRELATGTNTMFIDNTSVNAITENGGFVSSLGAGRLSRMTNISSGYLYPVGSSVGTLRIRPLRITPSSSAANTFAVRFANVDPTSDGFDRNNKANTVCAVNDKFYHLIDQTSGSSSIGLTMNYITAQDGNWAGIGHWQNVPQWQNTSSAALGTSGSYNTVTISNWSNFSYPPFALINFGATPTLSNSGNLLIVSGGGVSYQWFYNGQPIPGATGTTYDAADSGSGTYYVQVTYGDGCIGTSNVVELTVSISIEETDGLEQVNLYPNPSNGQFTIRGDLETSKDLRIGFTDVLGRIIRSDIVISNAISINENIDLSEHADGIYFIRLYTDKGSKTIRYVKN